VFNIIMFWVSRNVWYAYEYQLVFAYPMLKPLVWCTGYCVASDLMDIRLLHNPSAPLWKQTLFWVSVFEVVTGWFWRMPSSGMWRRVAHEITDLSVKCTAVFIRSMLQLPITGYIPSWLINFTLTKCLFESSIITNPQRITPQKRHSFFLNNFN
jgi:hypothetical protein